MIKTWNQRCQEHPDHQMGMVSHHMIALRMQEEIDELRAALAQPEPPQRKPLTDDRIDMLLNNERLRWATSPPTYEFAAAFARAIEAAHGIGGEHE